MLVFLELIFHSSLAETRILFHFVDDFVIDGHGMEPNDESNDLRLDLSDLLEKF